MEFIVQSEELLDLTLSWVIVPEGPDCLEDEKTKRFARLTHLFDLVRLRSYRLLKLDR